MRIATSIIDRVERSSTSDRWAVRVRRLVVPVVGRGRRRDLLTGRWLGHPVHPMSVVVPLGCWIGAAVADATGGRAGERVARRLTGLGVLAAMPAAASGAADWLDTQGAEQRVGTLHAAVNELAICAFAGSWLLRRREQDSRIGRLLSGAALALVGGAGYLGGHLAYTRGVGVNTTAFQSGPEEWTPLCDVAELERATLTRVHHCGIDLVAVRHDGISVLEDRCTHRGGPLSEGSTRSGCVICPWHGSRFSTADGHPERGPASVPQPVYETRVRGGRLEVRRDEPGALRANPVGAKSTSERRMVEPS